MSMQTTTGESAVHRPQTRQEVLARRFRFARASLAIEGLHLTEEEVAVFEQCVRETCTLEERTRLLARRFTSYADALRG